MNPFDSEASRYDEWFDSSDGQAIFAQEVACLHELMGKAEECSPEQIKKCHGDVKAHPCLPKKDDRKGGVR